jgi:hypothetical protein
MTYGVDLFSVQLVAAVWKVGQVCIKLWDWLVFVTVQFDVWSEFVVVMCELIGNIILNENQFLCQSVLR